MKRLPALVVLIALGFAGAGDAHARLRVQTVKLAGKGFKDPAQTIGVVIKGKVIPAGDLEPLAPVTLEIGDFSQTLALDASHESNKKVRFKADKGVPGIQRFTLVKKNGKFSLKIKDVDPAALLDAALITVDVGGSRFTAELELRGKGRRRSWKRGKDKLKVTVLGRVFRVSVLGRQLGDLGPLSAYPFEDVRRAGMDTLIVIAPGTYDGSRSRDGDGFSKVVEFFSVFGGQLRHLLPASRRALKYVGRA